MSLRGRQLVRRQRVRTARGVDEHRELVVDLIGKQQTILTSADGDIISIIAKDAMCIEL